jgi:hypothetical protein
MCFRAFFVDFERTTHHSRTLKTRGKERRLLLVCSTGQRGRRSEWEGSYGHIR